VAITEGVAEATLAGRASWDRMFSVYDNVIVPFDGALPGRVALAPAADLAWRCGARVVVVNNTEVQSGDAQAALKSRAMSMSGADVDFWVDTKHDLGGALLEAARFRSRPIICMAMRGKGGLRKRFTLPHLGEQVFAAAEVPVMVIGPNCDTSRGLPMLEIVASLDGSVASERILPLAASWARTLKLNLVLVGVVAANKGTSHSGEHAYLDGHAKAMRSQVPNTTFELVEAADAADGLVSYLRAHEDAVLCMSTHGRSKGRGVLGNVALNVIGASPRAVVLSRPPTG
jgi:nucleotide-binding universal stress UspA family protein